MRLGLQSQDWRRNEVLNFIDWAYKNGNQLALGLDCIPMPDLVVALSHDEWKDRIKDTSGKPIW